MHFIKGLPVCREVDTILMVVYRLSKYAHFLALRHPFIAFTVVQLFNKEVVRLHGFPSYIAMLHGLSVYLDMGVQVSDTAIL